jgi:5-methyltetrahydrofolate--homocysteine methyltransferase
MVPCDKIIQTAIEEKVDAIGLSGLITPSLDEMIYIAKEMERHHLKIPLIIGGATTSKIHTAVKIQPEYSSLVIHVKDASQSVNIINQIIHNYDNFSKEHKKNYQNIKEAYSTNQNKKTYISLKEARKNKWNINWNKTEIVKPDFLGNKVFIDYSLTEICKYIDWTQFFKTWELKGHFPNILNDKHYGTEAKKLYADAKDMLENIINNNLLSARAVIGFYSANTINDDDIKLNNSEGSIIHFLRQQLKKTNNIPNFCLADFIAPIESGKEDYIGFFAVSVGFGTRELEAKYKKINDDYNALMVRILSDRLTEAFIELIHEKVRKEYWGYAKEENLSIENMLDEKYIGIRPAPGYPACPDHTEKQLLFDLLEVEKNIGIKLTENYFMIPESSTCGYFFANPKAKYLSVGKILEDQIEDYANRKKLNISEMKQLLAKNLLI